MINFNSEDQKFKFKEPRHFPQEYIDKVREHNLVNGYRFNGHLMAYRHFNITPMKQMCIQTTYNNIILYCEDGSDYSQE